MIFNSNVREDKRRERLVTRLVFQPMNTVRYPINALPLRLIQTAFQDLALNGILGSLIATRSHRNLRFMKDPWSENLLDGRTRDYGINMVFFVI